MEDFDHKDFVRGSSGKFFLCGEVCPGRILSVHVPLQPLGGDTGSVGSSVDLSSLSGAPGLSANALLSFISGSKVAAVPSKVDLHC